MTAAGTFFALLTLAGLLGSWAYFWFSEAIAHGPLADGELGDWPNVPDGLRADRGELAAAADARPALGYAGTGNNHCAGAINR